MNADPSTPSPLVAPAAGPADPGCRCSPTSLDTQGWPVRDVRATRVALADAVPALRRLTRTWSEGSALDPDTAEDVVLAIDEAVTNVVEHAYPDRAGHVRLQLTRRECGELAVIVEDDGTWRPPPTDPGFRGRGLQLIDGLADHAWVTHTSTGTTVVMGWNARTAGPAEDPG